MGFEELMQGLGGSQASPTDILNNLLDSKDIELKTHLTINQIKGMVKLDWFEAVMNPENAGKDPFELFQQVIHEKMLKYMVSFNRMSRSESIDGVKHIPIMGEEPKPKSMIEQARGG